MEMKMSKFELVGVVAKKKLGLCTLMKATLTQMFFVLEGIGMMPELCMIDTGKER